jgi:hypothetical protein
MAFSSVGRVDTSLDLESFESFGISAFAQKGRYYVDDLKWDGSVGFLADGLGSQSHAEELSSKGRYVAARATRCRSLTHRHFKF